MSGFTRTQVGRHHSAHGVPIEDTPTRDLYTSTGSPLNATLCHLVDRRGTPLDVSDWVFAVDVRNRPLDRPAVLRCTPENGRLVIDEGQAQVSVSLSADDVRSIGEQDARYDLRATAPSLRNPIYPVRGTIHVERRATYE